jgi:hypothetical protein
VSSFLLRGGECQKPITPSPFIIRDSQENPNPRLQYEKRLRAIFAAKQQYRELFGPRNGRVLVPYFPRCPIPAGDPISPDGTKISVSELGDDTLAFIQENGGGRSPWRAFSMSGNPALANDPMDINLGTFVTAGAQTVISSFGTLMLPPTAADFRDDTRFRVLLDGQEQIKGALPGDPNTDVYWVSATQIAFNFAIYNQSVIEVETAAAFFLPARRCDCIGPG